MTSRDPDVERIRRELEATSPTYRVRAVLRAATGPMTTAQVAAAAGVTSSQAYYALRHERQTGRAVRLPSGSHQAVLRPPARGRGPRAGVGSAQSDDLPRTDRHGRRVLMIARGGPRREDCVHYDACLAIAARVTTGDAHCPRACAHYQRRDSRVTERDMVSGYDRSEEYTV